MPPQDFQQPPAPMSPMEPPAPMPPMQPFESDKSNSGSGKSKKKALLIAGLVIAVVAIGGLAFVFLGNKDVGEHPSASTTKTPSTGKRAAAHPQFYFTSAEAGQPLIYVDAITGKQTTQKLTMHGAIQKDVTYSALSVNPSDANQPLQLSGDGKVLAYSLQRQTVTGTEGLSAAEPDGFSILAGSRAGKLQTILAGKNFDNHGAAGVVTDWLLSTDGKQVYYLQTNGQNGTTADLYSIAVSTAQSKKLSSLPFTYTRSHTRLFAVDGRTSLRYFIDEADGIHEISYNLETQKSTDRLAVTHDKYQFGTMDILSPDGKSLIYRASNSDLPNVITYRFDLQTGTAQTLYNPSDKGIAYNPQAWSSDSSKLLVSTGPYGGDAQNRADFPYRLISYDVKTNKQTVVTKYTGPGLPAEQQAGSYEAARYSPDGTYIAYTHGKKLYMYDTAKGKTLDKPVISLKDTFYSDSAFGWIQ